MTHNSLPHPADNFVGSYENLTAAISFPTQKALVQIVFSTNRCHFIFMVILMAFLLSPLGLLQPHGDRVSRFIYSIHIYHWLLQQDSDTCCFVLFLSEIAIKLFHIRKELLWYQSFFPLFFFFPSGYRFGCQIHQLRKKTWGPDENVRKSFVTLAQRKKTLVVSTALSPCSLPLAQCGKKSPQKVPLETIRKSLALPKNACRVAVCVAYA